MNTTVCTIGFAKKSLQKFVELLHQQEVKHLIDTRLNNTSQLSGYSKRDDLNYVMDLVGVQYTHALQLAPEEQMLKDYKKKLISWDEYEKNYLGLLEKRKIEKCVDEYFSQGRVCFLCSEEKPHHCHRRLLAEYLKETTNVDMKIVHLI